MILMISLTWRIPIKPVETPKIPYSAQLGAAFFEGDSGSKSLKLGLFLYKLKTNFLKDIQEGVDYIYNNQFKLDYIYKRLKKTEKKTW